MTHQSPRRLAGASAPKTGHRNTTDVRCAGNVRPIPLAELQRIFADALEGDAWFLALREECKPTLADEIASVIRDPIVSYMLGIVSGAAATVVAAFVWGVLL